MPVVGQPQPNFSLSYELEPGPLEVVGFDAPLWGGPLWEQSLKHAPRHPDHTPVLADLDHELRRLPIGIPRASSGNDGWETVPLTLSF